MSSFLCFICHSTVNSDTSEEIREKYRDVVSMNLCPDSHLCVICCHVLSKLWLFRSVCLKRSLEYPVLFTEKGTINLQKTDTEVHNLCPEDHCLLDQTFSPYHWTHVATDSYGVEDQYELFEERLDEGVQCKEDELAKNEEINYNEQIQEHEEIDQSIPENENLIAPSELSPQDYNDYTEFDENPPSVTVKIKTPKKKIKKQKELSFEEQKLELDRRRKEKKYMDSEFKCYNCAMGFLFKDTYQVHMMRHEESNGSHVCPVCTLRFASAAVARAHARSHARLKPVAKIAESAQACHLCAKVFRDRVSLSAHVRRRHAARRGPRPACQLCGAAPPTKAALRTHMIKHLNKKFTCDKCPATYRNPYTLTAHRKKHEITEVQQFFCHICNISYSSKKSLLAHKKNSMAHQQTIIECPICYRICASRQSLDSHMQSIHSHIKPYACDICSNKYATKKSLVRHLGTHREKKEPKIAICFNCGATFKGNNKLNRHLKNVCDKQKNNDEDIQYDTQLGIV